jgi:nitrogen regulatory protein PII
MKRLEIIANQAVEEDIIEVLESVGHGEAFTYFHPVYGRGKKGRREGSPVWPETNVMFLVYLDSETAYAVIAKMKDLKEVFPAEGIKCWLGDGPGEEV